MTNNLSEPARTITAKTLPLMERHREPLVEKLERYMARQGPHDPSGEGANATARAIMDMLLDHARQPGAGGPAAKIAETARRHRALALGGEHYSSFGDGLKPVMKDVLGREATAPVLAAWTDAYWGIVRMLRRQETRLAA